MALKIAHVGTTPDDHENQGDNHLVASWIVKNDPALQERWMQGVVRDYIALDEGRDFLAEKNKYDVVILHRLYGDPDFMEADTGYLAQSSLQTPRNWRIRLIQTRASYIFALGGPLEISGDYIGDLPSMEKIKERWMTVYRRKASARRVAHMYIQRDK
jgi:hypothetical protein